MAVRREPRTGTDEHRQEARDARIKYQVLRALGKPNNLLRVQVRPLWADYCRVNVYVGTDATSARMAHSYFVRADGDGNVVTPTINKLY
jgi:hypothetical protein